MRSSRPASLHGVKVLVTGGTGFIGSHLVDSLLQAGADVRCLVRPTSRLRWLDSRAVSLICGDVEAPDDVSRAMQECSIVYHVAGAGLARMRQGPAVNVAGTLSLVQACTRSRHVRKVVYVSSIKASRPSSNLVPVTEKEPPACTDDYGRSKWEAETALGGLPQEICSVIVRPPLVFGPRDTNLIPLFRLAKRGLLPLLAGDQGPRFSAVYVEDLANALVAMGDEQVARSDTLFVASEEIYSWNVLVTVISRVLGRNQPHLSVPVGLLSVLAGVASWGFRMAGRPDALPPSRIRDLLEHNWLCSVEKANSRYQVACTTALEEAMRRTAQGYVAAGWL